ncbi:peptide/nickel transport system substrate-binding protein [Streptomyces sp. SAI-229]
MRNQWPVLPVLAGLASTLMTGCGVLPDDGPHVVVGMSDDVLATDPASGYDPGSWLLFNNVFQSLLGFPNGGTEPQPEAAESCSFTDTHARVYRCTLKDGLEFSNGDPLTSQDVKFSFDRLLRIDDEAGPAIMFQNLDTVQTPDEKTVVFRLGVPDATFPSKVASAAGSIVDHRQYEAVFSVNENYRGTAAEAKNSGVTLKLFHADQSALKRAVADGRADIAYRGLSSHDIAYIKLQSDREGIEAVEGNSAEVQHLVFNMDDPVAGRLGVRKAIAHLIDRDALVKEVYQDTAAPLYSIVPTGIAGHNTAFFDTYGADPSRAKAAAALRTEGIMGKVELTLWSTPSRYGPATGQELKVIANQLNTSGLFDAEVRSVPFDQYEKDISAGRYGVYVKGWVPDYPDPDNFMAPFFGEGNVLDNNHMNRDITDTLLPRTAAESDRTATDASFGRIQDIVAEQLPVLPVWQGKQYAVVRDGVSGLDHCLDPSTVFRFWELTKN